MGELLKFPTRDNYFYAKDEEGDKIIGCGTENLCFVNEGDRVLVTTSVFPVDKSEVKELMIMWLALNYPDVLKFDGEET